MASMPSDQVAFVTTLVLILLALPNPYALTKRNTPTDTGIPQSDIDAVQVAMNLEFLEADFFSYAAFGHGLDQIDSTLSGGGPPPICGTKANLDPLTLDIMKQFAYQEVDHLLAIRSHMKLIPRPQLNLSREVFANIMNLAFETDLDPPFDIYANTINFLLGSYLIPYVGLTGYVGASANLQSPAIKKLVSGLEGVESGQDALIRYMLYQCQSTWRCRSVFPYGVTVAEFTRRLSVLRDSLGGTGKKDEGIVVEKWDGAHKDITGNVLAGTNYSLSYDRSPAEIFRIVYGTADETEAGGFFPEGCNGNLARGFLSPSQANT